MLMKQNIPNFINLKALLLIVLIAVAGVLMYAPSAQATALNNTYVRFDRMRATNTTPFRVVITVPAGNSATESRLVISFPDSYTVNTTQTTSVSTCPSEATATALPGTLSATGSNTNGSKGVTITGVTNLTASTKYCVDLTSASAVTNPAAGQYQLSVETQDSGSAQIDSANLASRVISNDQITISAVVPPTFSFTLDGNTDSFSTNLDPASIISTSGRTITVATNAPFGWIAWVKSANAGLTSATASKTIATAGTIDGSASTLSAGTEGYVLDTNSITDAGGGCTLAIAGEYNGSTSGGGTLSSTVYQQIAACTGGTASNDVIQLIERAAIAGSTPAGNDYTDTLTVIGAANF